MHKTPTKRHSTPRTKKSASTSRSYSSSAKHRSSPRHLHGSKIHQLSSRQFSAEPCTPKSKVKNFGVIGAGQMGMFIYFDMCIIILIIYL